MPKIYGKHVYGTIIEEFLQKKCVGGLMMAPMGPRVPPNLFKLNLSFCLDKIGSKHLISTHIKIFIEFYEVL